MTQLPGTRAGRSRKGLCKQALVLAAALLVAGCRPASPATGVAPIGAPTPAATVVPAASLVEPGPTSGPLLNIVEAAGLAGATRLEILELDPEAPEGYVPRVLVTDTAVIGRLVAELDTELELGQRARCPARFKLRFELGDGTDAVLGYACDLESPPFLRGAQGFWRGQDAMAPGGFGDLIRSLIENTSADGGLSAGRADGWMGTIVKAPPGGGVDAFERGDGGRYGIVGADDDVRRQIQGLSWSGSVVRVWGTLRHASDTGGRQVWVTRVEAVSGPAPGARNLSPFASAQASSSLPPDRGGAYGPAAAIDGLRDTAWAEAAAGPGIGEALTLTFPGPVQVTHIGLAVGYDRDEGLFRANNRVREATLRFSSGEEVTLTFDDVRGVQEHPLDRASGPPIETTSVELIIDAIYSGTTYDDTCVSELEVWGTVTGL